ncbi:MAG: DNA polymerase III subunit beta [Bacteroidetes bacterium]|nr:DNA polymerase III subunit beta [Bacteroidota bacterium]
MKFTVSQAELSKALARVINVVPTKTTLPVLGNILLKVDDGALTLTATDLDVSVTTKIAVDVKKGGSLTVPSKPLNDLVKNLPNIPLEISADPQFKLLVTCDKGDYRISGESDDDYPALPIIDQKASVKIDAKMLSRMIGKTTFAVSTDTLRPALTGVLFQIVDKEFRLVATDGHRLAKMICRSFESNVKEKLNVVVPTKALTEVAKETRDTISVQVGQNHVRFDMTDAQLYSRILDETYPDYERVIPSNNDKKLTIETQTLVDAFKRVSIFANPITHQVRLSLAKKGLTLSAEDMEGGSTGSEKLAAEYEGDDLQIGYNSQLVLAALNHIDTKETVIAFKSPTSAGVVTPAEQADGEDHMMLVMPVRLND